MASDPNPSNPATSNLISTQSVRRVPWASETLQENGDASEHINGHASQSHPQSLSQLCISPSDPKSPAGISIRAFFLGVALGISFSLVVFSLSFSSPLWRPPFFLLTLSLFHFLEYYATARYNSSAATTSAFLLSSNGIAYNIAHTLSFLESFIRNYYFFSSSTDLLSLSPHTICLTIGIILTLLGQVTRTVAMAHAGSNFNHLVQSTKKQGHVLVTDGIYAWLRHPSYFGFFWWGLGTQLVLGNAFCLIGYAIVLWRFFRKRIESEYLCHLCVDTSRTK